MIQDKSCEGAKAMANETLWNADTFVAHLRAVGVERYHHKHPFHLDMHNGKLTQKQVRNWIANRFYYQRNLPLKDAAIIANCPLQEVRRIWVKRILNQDGTRDQEGGIQSWIRMGEAAGLKREEFLDDRHVVPGVRFAVDAYVNFAHSQPWPIAIASSLSELFVPDLMQERIAAFEKHYTWLPGEGLEYFRSRITQAHADSDDALQLTIQYCNTRQLQDEAIKALSFKCDVLWAMLDALS